MQPIIEVENLSKRYRLGQFNARSLREEIERLFRRAPGGANGRADESEFWALRDVSFTVAPGQVVGIIGRNGAGKSTLLKILSRVTEPTGGSARIRGRVASLLEVGTGFHPELTGRENIYLNGAILGMTRAEIRRKFDEIVDFSGVEKFLDTPVKRYSSGMYVRLAFAVAAHLEPEILIVDEVLAVGDAEFQKKCLGKMRAVSEKESRTVLFVSHNMPAVETLCREAIHVDQGRVLRKGSSAQVVAEYLRSTVESSRALLEAGEGQFVRACIVSDRGGSERDYFRIGEDIVFEIRLYSENLLSDPRCAIAISTSSAERIATLRTDIQQRANWSFRGAKSIRAVWKKVPLNAGTYRIDVALWNSGREIESLIGARELVIQPRDVYKTGVLPDPSYQGYLMADAEWEMTTSELCRAETPDAAL